MEKKEKKKKKKEALLSVLESLSAWVKDFLIPAMLSNLKM